jgi:hypothetical protein
MMVSNPLRIVRELGEALFEPMKLTNFVGTARCLRQFGIFGRFGAILSGSEHGKPFCKRRQYILKPRAHTVQSCSLQVKMRALPFPKNPLPKRRTVTANASPCEFALSRSSQSTHSAASEETFVRRVLLDIAGFPLFRFVCMMFMLHRRVFRFFRSTPRTFRAAIGGRDRRHVSRHS